MIKMRNRKQNGKSHRIIDYDHIYNKINTK